MTWIEDMDIAMHDFLRVADLAGEPIDSSQIIQEYLEAPHIPPKKLPVGKMGVYGFWGDGQWLKVGKVGPNSNARYTSQHYTGSAISTLAGSLEKDEFISGFAMNSSKRWIMTNTHRANILLDARQPKALLSLLESFLHARLKPRYEG